MPEVAQRPAQQPHQGMRPGATPPARTGETVTVACKLPHGLVLKLYSMVDSQEPVMGGGTRTVKVAQQRGAPVVIKGTALPFGAARPPMPGGYALTHGVPADFFEEWLRQNEDLDAVQNGLIFAQPKEDSATAQAKEQRKTRSGLEPIDRSGDPRMPRRIKPFDPRDTENE